MKKLFKAVALLTTLMYLLSSCVVLAETTNIPEKVEIRFTVGDDILYINGQETKVETPYVVGAGVTLVPLRVITEAFGATVTWIESTQSIELTYPDVFIVLQINNPIAEVNQKAEQLLSAPELTAAGYTMVPLRFISETFGAVVTYDEATEAITVIKENNNEEQMTVQGTITEANIGDSYYQWSMENPKDMVITKRTFDGTSTEFVYDDKNGFEISIFTVPEDYDFEKTFANIKNSFSDYTLVKAEKNTVNTDKKIAYFQAKTKDVFVNLRHFFIGNYIIEVYGSFANKTPEIRDEAVRIMATFDTTFVKSQDIHDLSNVKNRVRLFTGEEVGFSIEIPQNYYMVSKEDIENEFTFAVFDSSNDISRINVGIYSKSELGSAHELAQKDYEQNKVLYNPSLATYSNVISVVQYADFQAFEYDATLSGKYEEYFRDVFFEKGEYIYNVSVRLKMENQDVKTVATTILNSIKAKEIDATKVGILLRNSIFEQDGTYTSKEGKWSLELPHTFQEVKVENLVAYYAEEGTGIAIVMESVEDSSISLYEMGQAMQQTEATYGEVVKKTDKIKLGNMECHTFTTRIEDDGEVAYLKTYGVVKNGIATLFFVYFPELYYSDANQEEVDTIIMSYQCK